jgi:hypothetical protein
MRRPKCKIRDLSFQSLSREIATRHLSHAGELGELIDSVIDVEHRLAGASAARVLGRIESASPIMLGP